jgi:cell division protein FtsB
MKRAAWLLIVSVILVGFLFVAVFPTRTYLAQRRDLARTERRLEVLSGQNAELAERVRRLNTDAEIERLAREQYNLVRPGEEAYAILPPPAPPDPRGDARDGERRGLLSRLWDGLTFWG